MAHTSALSGPCSVGNLIFNFRINLTISYIIFLPSSVVIIVPFIIILPADWWDQHGGDCSELKEVARRIVPQCVSSSGCERNWSTFALVHTKLRNRLSYDKLHKLVYVHYNLKLRIQHFEADKQTLQEMQTNHERDLILVAS